MMIKKKIKSFDLSFKTTVNYISPKTYKELENISKRSKKIITMGNNYSYAPIFFEKKSLSIDTKNFKKIINFNKNKKEITVESGLEFVELLNFTLKHNLWIQHIPGYPNITIGGAVAANIHGKTAQKNGTIRNSVKEILLFHKKKGWLKLSNKQNKEIFELTLGGLGLTGTIVRVTLKLSYFNHKIILKKKLIKNFNEAINFLRIKKKSSFSYSWHDSSCNSSLGKGIIFSHQFVKEKKKNHIVIILKKKLSQLGFVFPFSLWNRVSVFFANFIFYYLNSITKFEQINFIDSIFPFYGKENYFKFFGNKGFVEYQVLIPEKNINKFIQEFENLIKEYKPLITLISLKYLGGSHTLLRFEGNSPCLTINFVNNSKNLLFINLMHNLLIKYNCLPNIIKNSLLKKEIVKKCYNNELVKFKKKLLSFDKNRIYASEVSKRLCL